MKIFTFLVLFLCQFNCTYNLNFGLPFYKKDFVSTNKTFGKQKRFYPMHVNPRDYLGTNFEVRPNAKVISIESGEIEFIGNTRSLGEYIIISHKKNVKAKYYHLKEIKVKVGDKIKKGTEIGISSDIGLTTVNSIGLEISINDKVVDPMKILNNNIFD